MSNPYYKNTQIQDNQFYKVPRYIDVDFSDIPGKELLIDESMRLDILAEQIYGKAIYWKAIAIYNGIGWFFDIKPGTTIKLPNKIEDVLSRL